MACISSRTYGTVAAPPDPASLHARRQSIRRWSIIASSTVLLLIVAIVSAVSITHNKSSNNDDGEIGGPSPTLSTSVKALCSSTLYPASCLTTLNPIANSSQALDPMKLFRFSVQTAITELSSASNRLKNLDVKATTNSNYSSQALSACYELIDLAIDQLDNSISSSSSSNLITDDDVRSWMSAAITYQETCIDAFEATPPYLKDMVSLSLKNSSEFASNSLAIFNQVSSLFGSVGGVVNGGDFPSWVTSKDRKLLQKSSEDPRVTADIVVAKDGSGKYKTIKAALAAVPEKSKKRTVIYVKKGVYYENVKVEKYTWNLMMVGDGMGATVVSGNLNVVDGTPTFQSATFAVFGKGFIGRDMCFRNTAGASKHQAVALMSDSDQSAFYRCRFDAYQDTLYTHSMRQFYRDCDIYGTVDFIFGNAAVVLQNCNIYPRRPLPGQQDTITAQGKVDPNQNTGISIHQCAVQPLGDLSGVRVYLGRPWKAYSTTMFMKSSISGVVDPAGWLPWTGNSAPDTIFYAEYENFGAGASTKNRVKWKGLRSLNARQAGRFTAGGFIGGEAWIGKAGVPFQSGL
ncbi:pectinesterase-like [Dendrobium catenatum]|uniref:Pectinesterase n=1 Tax=Dendrobium catenatum TaxID=906689 RepID=A0A2I0V755_9ASPA|nr:pectinesterase-like [Dendrobium catenatum]PKU59242.1 Putative pectinesterase/pectinesterase inhibitor 24 [Dendrobium catenatum]